MLRAFVFPLGYLWGLDLSGSLRSAGGIGGLLEIGAGTTNCYVGYDGNDNVMLLANSAGTDSARFEYGPFGEVLRLTGPMAKANPFRFSTKYQDDETDLLYYGYRYYNAGTGRWLSRDPSEEKGGINLYVFDLNDPIDFADALGLDVQVFENSLSAMVAWPFFSGTATFTFTMDNDACSIDVSGPTWSGWRVFAPDRLEAFAKLVENKKKCEGGHMVLYKTYRLELWLVIGYEFKGLGWENWSLANQVNVVNVLSCTQCCK